MLFFLVQGTRILIHGRIYRAQGLLWARRFITVRSSVLRCPFVERANSIRFHGGVTRRLSVVHAANAVVASDKHRAIKGFLIGRSRKGRPIFTLVGSFKYLRRLVAIMAIRRSMIVLFLVVMASAERNRAVFPSKGLRGLRFKQYRCVQVMVIYLCFLC